MFYDRFVEVCKSRKTAPSAVALSIGISKSNVTNWKKGSAPGMHILIKLANELNVSLDELVPKE